MIILALVAIPFAALGLVWAVRWLASIVRELNVIERSYAQPVNRRNRR